MSETSFSKTVAALGWNTIGNLVATIGSFISLIVIARMLTPADFGLYLLALLTVSFLGLLTGALQQAIVQNQALETRHIDTIWTTSFVINSVLTLLLLVCVPWIGQLFRTPEIAPLLYACSVFLLLDVVINTSAAILWRNLAFKAMALCDLMSSLASIAVGISLAIWLKNPWALVGMEMTRRVIKALFLLYQSGWRPKWYFEVQALRDIASYSLNMTYLDAIARVQTVSIGYAISGFMGTAALGLYNLANRFLEQTRQALVYPALSISFPILSKHQDHPDQFREAHKNCASLATLIGLPAYSGAIIVLPDLIPILFSDKWVPAIATTQLAMLAGCAMALASVNGNVLRAIGRPDLLVRIVLIGFVLILIGLAIASQYGIEVVMMAIIVKELIFIGLTGIEIKKHAGLNWLTQFRPTFGPVISALFMFVVLMLVKESLAADWSPLFRSLSLVALGVGIYLGSLFVLDKPLIGQINTLLRRA